MRKRIILKKTKMSWSPRLKHNKKERRLEGTNEGLGNYVRKGAYVMLLKKFKSYYFVKLGLVLGNNGFVRRGLSKNNIRDVNTKTCV
jgi:hypothetical protein